MALNNWCMHMMHPVTLPHIRVCNDQYIALVSSRRNINCSQTTILVPLSVEWYSSTSTRLLAEFLACRSAQIFRDFFTKNIPIFRANLPYWARTSTIKGCLIACVAVSCVVMYLSVFSTSLFFPTFLFLESLYLCCVYVWTSNLFKPTN